MHSIDRASAKECVGPGWAGLIDVLYTAMPDMVVVSTVKEKFGCLRVYADGGDLNFEQLVNQLETVSNLICERCGKIGGRRSIGGWLTTLCDDHYIVQKATKRSTDHSQELLKATQKATAPTVEAG